MGEYYLWQTVVRFACASFLAYGMFNRRAGRFLQALSVYFLVVAVGRGIFIYRASAGLQQADPLMLVATTLETGVLLGMAYMLHRKKFD
jgi:hypothetical protein